MRTPVPNGAPCKCIRVWNKFYPHSSASNTSWGLKLNCEMQVIESDKGYWPCVSLSSNFETWAIVWIPFSAPSQLCWWSTATRMSLRSWEFKCSDQGFGKLFHRVPKIKSLFDWITNDWIGKKYVFAVSRSTDHTFEIDTNWGVDSWIHYVWLMDRK